jgi:actin-related protein
LETELKKEAPDSVEIKVVASPQRHIAVWAGGSVLAMAQHFNYHWISRDEYKEYGLEMAHHSI